MNKKTLVFSPTFNEKNNVIKFINFFKLKYSKLDLLVIDDIRPITLSKFNISCCSIATKVCNSINVINTQVESPNKIVPNNPINIVLVFLVIYAPLNKSSGDTFFFFFLP